MFLETRRYRTERQQAIYKPTHTAMNNMEKLQYNRRGKLKSKIIRLHHLLRAIHCFLVELFCNQDYHFIFSTSIINNWHYCQHFVTVINDQLCSNYKRLVICCLFFASYH